MPLYEYSCQECAHTTEAMFKHTERPNEIECEECGHAATFIISLFAKTPNAWGFSNPGNISNVNGYYSTSLGQQVSSFKEAEKMAEKSGFSHASNFEKHIVEDSVENLRQRNERISKTKLHFQKDK